MITFGTTDRPVDLLRGGEAMSALLLQATADGVAAPRPPRRHPDR